MEEIPFIELVYDVMVGTILHIYQLPHHMKYFIENNSLAYRIHQMAKLLVGVVILLQLVLLSHTQGEQQH